MTKEIRTVEFVVLPTSRAKARKMFQIAGACRFVWNHFRERNLAGYQAFRNGKDCAQLHDCEGFRTIQDIEAKQKVLHASHSLGRLGETHPQGRQPLREW